MGEKSNTDEESKAFVCNILQKKKEQMVSLK
jgi:hypothetical protein